MKRPSPPKSLPKYVHEPLAKQDISKLQDVIEYAEELIEYQQSKIATELEPEDDTIKTVENDDATEYTRVVKRVTCGDDSCKCASGRDADMHGPYVYHVRRDGDSLHWEYIGKA